MNRKASIFGALAVLAGLFLISTPASASDYTGSCSDAPSSVSGNATINDGDCTHSITATGYIRVTAGSVSGPGVNLESTGAEVKISSSGSVTVGNISSATQIDIDASGNVTTSVLNAATHIDIDTTGEVITGNINASSNGHIKITANKITNPSTVTMTSRYEIDIQTDDKVTTGDLTSSNGHIDIDAGSAEIETGEINAPQGHIKITGSKFTTDNKDLTSRYEIDIHTDGGDTDIGNGNLTTDDYYIRVRADNIRINDVTVNKSGHVLLYAEKNLKAHDVNGAADSAASFGYSVDIQVNRDGTNSEFRIGASGDNSVNSITAHPKGNPDSFASTIIEVKNGTENSTGGIAVSDASKISAAATASARAGYIFLDANDGILSFPNGGTLAADGTGSSGAGVISLQAKTVSFGATATVSASQTSTTGTLHGVLIAAETVNHNGLTLKGNGNGIDQYSSGYVQLFPKRAITVTNNEDPASLNIYGTIDFSKEGNITYSGSSLLKMEANGDGNRVYVYSSKSTFTGGAVTIESKGASTHTIVFATTGSLTGSNGVVFNGGAVTLDASANSSGTGGDINFYVDKVVMDAPSIIINANGPSSGSGDNGGKIYLSASEFALNAGSTATLSANGGGTGNAIFSALDTYDPKAIILWPGSSTVKLGTGAGQFSFSAKGGASGGNGGAVTVGGSGVQLMTEGAVDVSARAGNGDGGGFRSYPYITSVASGLSSPVIVAKGKGTGKGGRFQTWHSISKIDIHKIVNVDGGTSMLSTSEGDYGRLTLNEVICQRRATNVSDFPVYANCRTTDSSSDLDQAPASVVNSELSTRIGTDTRIKLYVFSTRGNYQSFFSFFNSPTPGSGETWVASETDASTNIYSSVWEINPDTSNAFSENTLKETTIHEVGHAFDHLIGQDDQSGSSDYDDYAQRDFADLDYAIIGATQGASTPRPACVAYGATPAPFLNVMDRAPSGQGGPQYVCHASGDTSAPGTTLNSRYSGMTNHQILQYVWVGEYWFTKHNNLFNELYAQALAFEAFAGPNNHQAYSVPDNVFKNGRFACTRNWAVRVKQGHNTPSTGCTRVDWYTY